MAKKISKLYESEKDHDALAKKAVKVRVTAGQPIMERGEVYFPALRNPDGKIIKQADVFVTDAARLLKIKWAVEQVPDSTPVTEKGTKEDEARSA